MSPRARYALVSLLETVDQYPWIFLLGSVFWWFLVGFSLGYAEILPPVPF
jgi:hypothetical protein